MKKLYVQYGCGLSAPNEWVNFDSSPTLKTQKIPLFGKLIVKISKRNFFPDNVMYGDIIKGLPVEQNSCAGVYCSHVLEHLSLFDFRIALKNTYLILNPGGIFRCVLPDLEFIARSYINDIDNKDATASIKFIGNNSLLGHEKRERGIKAILKNAYANSNHLWMWDQYSLANELKNAGFKNIRVCRFNDSHDKHFLLVEDKSRFENALAMECEK